MIRKRAEKDGSITLCGLTDGTGQERQLNLHGYRVASCNQPLLNIAILDKKGKPVASVILESDHVKDLLMQVVEMI